MRSPYSPLQLAGFVALLVVLALVVQIGIIRIAFDKLGLTGPAATFLVVGSLLGSAINLPLFTLRSEHSPRDYPPLRGWLLSPRPPRPGHTVVAVNLGGGIIPLAVVIYLLQIQGLELARVALATVVVSLVCYRFSRPIAGLGIGMPMLIAPLTATLGAWILAPAHSAPVAYISGCLGVLIGADLLRLRDIRELGTPFASIGGAGTFDGIFLTGIVAALLA